MRDKIATLLVVASEVSITIIGAGIIFGVFAKLMGM